MAEQRRGQVDDQRGAELEKLGVKPQDAAAWLAEQDCLDEGDGEGGPAARELQAGAAPLVVWPENWPVVNLFIRLETQWRKDPGGRLQGLRYEAAETVMRLGGFKRKRRLFLQLQEMENEALRALEA